MTPWRLGDGLPEPLGATWDGAGVNFALAAPRAEGWGLTAYVIPIAFFLIGGPVVVLIIRRLVAGGTNGEAPQTERTERTERNGRRTEA